MGKIETGQIEISREDRSKDKERLNFNFELTLL